ncbi:glycoside hydrolase family 13 protein [Naasia lichenicola]|uniref:Glycoside hydrolase family 13 protein n=1 Tax=Naasia lichenicola TaxID=2565933 RepID=A0A4S4FLB5_9MICO|nr:glycoside hydrolase family 13 protein [Naasia lichenicola]THG31139.1 glycoside hydrolase family 13 protein [Naasia lichenicola]
MDAEDFPTATRPADEWWRSAVIYQIYPRSFADGDGDGIGDLPGIDIRLPALRELGVDAVWLSPFYTSPQHDAGYDVADYRDVDPRFGTLADFDELLAHAHSLDLKVIVDLVPNHSSSDHVWFQEALAAAPGSPERARYLFRDGTGPNGDEAPNNWESVFGGPAWTRITEADGTPGQWYLHLFDTTQPDFDWTNRWVHEQFLDILRFWLDRGADGFRVDVAHGLVKEAGLPDWTAAEGAATTMSLGGSLEDELTGHAEQDPPTPPYWAQDGVHEIYREWHQVLAEYEGDRVLVAEAWVEPLSRVARWVRDDEMHQTFNFGYLETPWSATSLRTVIAGSLKAFGDVGAPSTWVLSNHDVMRHASRLALTRPSTTDSAVIDPWEAAKAAVPDAAVGLRRARAASTLMLALPGSAYIYQGEELGLPEVFDIPDADREDPVFSRTNGERVGRDGCRVPIPWEADAPAYGFNATGESWLPQPREWRDLARDTQQGVPGSTLELYRATLAERSRRELGTGSIEWLSDYGDDVVAFVNNGVTVIANLGEVAVELPVGDVLLSSEALHEAALPIDTTVWVLVTPDE